MGLPSTPRLVEEAIRDRILTLNPVSAERQQGRIAVEWHESKTPLTVLSTSAPKAHLAFSVWCSSASSEGNRMATQFVTDPNVDPDIEDTIDCRSRVTVAYTYSLRPGQQTADAREANDAAVEVARAVLAAWTAADESSYGTITLIPSDLLQPGLTVEAHWLLIVQEYIADYELDLVP